MDAINQVCGLATLAVCVLFLLALIIVPMFKAPEDSWKEHKER